MPLYLSSLWKSGYASLYSLVYAVLSTMVSRFSYRSLKAQTNSLYALAFMEHTIMILLLFLYHKNRYALPLFEVTGNFPVRSQAVFLMW